MKYTQVRTSTPRELQLNAGIMLKNFDPTTATFSAADIMAATTGGFSFSDTVSYKDLFEDIDNAPKNTKEGKQIESREVKFGGTALTVTPESVKSLMAAADIDNNDETHIVPRDTLTEEDFEDFWWVGDYSDKNGENNGGFMAIHIMNALSTGGLNFKTSDNGKGQFTMDYTAHYSIEDIKKVPYEVYIKSGTDETTQSN